MNKSKSEGMPTEDQSVASHAQTGGMTAQNIHIGKSDAVLKAQLKELKKLDKFVVRKGEVELRSTFDLTDMVRFNVRDQARRLTGKPEPEVDQYFADGGSRISLTKVVVNRETPETIAQINPIPGHIWSINITAKYVKNRDKLGRFINSSQLPSSVTDAVKKLDEAVERNSSLLLDIMDERFRANRKNITEHEDTTSSRCGGINNAYWSQFENLKPFADQIGGAVRKFMKAP